MAGRQAQQAQQQAQQQQVQQQAQQQAGTAKNTHLKPQVSSPYPLYTAGDCHSLKYFQDSDL